MKYIPSATSPTRKGKKQYKKQEKTQAKKKRINAFYGIQTGYLLSISSHLSSSFIIFYNSLTLFNDSFFAGVTFTNQSIGQIHALIVLSVYSAKCMYCMYVQQDSIWKEYEKNNWISLTISSEHFRCFAFSNTNLQSFQHWHTIQ